jgi:hypothetical protein
LPVRPAQFGWTAAAAAILGAALLGTRAVFVAGTIVGVGTRVEVALAKGVALAGGRVGVSVGLRAGGVD